MKENSIILHKENGEILRDIQIEGLKIDFFGQGNSVEIEEGSVFHNCHFKMRERCKIVIMRTHERGLRNTVIDMAGSYDGYIEIDARTSIESARFAMANENKPYIYIGQDCMLSSNITFRATDGHVIFDINSKKILNKSKPIKIGSRVWIGSGATILKGSRVLNDSIIATQAVVSKKFELPNIIIGGNPAKILKYNINWDRQYIRDSGEYFE
jgi:acetyltransferase-like isoleucine patch superfamily enzyme